MRDVSLVIIAAIHRDTVLCATWEAYLAGIPMTWLMYGEHRP